ncbi:Uu.00g070860.m01.CDS01 [Anthostomella pinea]|uniref:Uu.00g070860.m01.CDS01 n=1 Tax=Anthostomella pinea TaxID=933095 RepID=A0AAI8VUT6_9PEZI|nr:Uu.00g070860.m01.CDS01 [Anthostomella pinea]
MDQRLELGRERPAQLLIEEKGPTKILADKHPTVSYIFKAAAVTATTDHQLQRNDPPKLAAASESERYQSSQIRNKILFALGIFLIELCLNKTFEEIRRESQAASHSSSTDLPSSIVDDFEIADRQLDRIYLDAGNSYGYAVQRCLRCEFPGRDVTKTFDFQAFRRHFFSGVVAPVQATKFGKQIQKRQLEVPEYAASFVNYKALKKLIKKLSATPTLSALNDHQYPPTPVDTQVALQANKAKFFFQLERELEKVNAFYLQKEAELKIRLKTLLDKKKVLQSRQGVSRRSAKFTTLEEGFQQFANDLNKLQQFIEINGTAFSKILKKWDKTSKSKTKELYLSRAVEVQPFFNAPVISELSDQATTSLQELGAWADGDHVTFETRTEHMVSSQHLLGTDEGDADSLLLDIAITGNLDSLRDLLARMQAASSSPATMNISLMERVTRTFLAAIHEAPQASLEVLLATGLVDIRSEDDINERNCLHQATIYGNSFVLGVGLSGGVAVNRTDVYGRVPLHYASMHGRLDMLEALLQANPTTIDLIDHDNFTPLIHAIIHGHLACVKRLLATSSRSDPVSETDHIPLNLACEHGSVEIVELLLQHGAQILPDAEGLYPQHLVARSGQTPRLLRLLQQYGADLDQVDKLYGWTPLVHAASEGNVPCLQELLNVGVDPTIVDEKDLPAMYYAAWEGHLACMQLLTPCQRDKTASPFVPQPSGSLLTPLGSGSAPDPMSLDADAIPVLELPPPIIPLRRYGHNFLDTKTVVQISFEGDGNQPLVFFHDSKYPASRLTISSKLSDLIPKNIMLPFQEDTRLVSFQIDNLDTFTLDFDVFPTYGAKIIAKTVALPNTFRASLSSSGRCCLPLFDPRLRAIGQITFNTQVIKPFQGAPLEITDFETYWKATSQLDQNPNMFVTGSSLSGDFVQVYVQHTSDGIPVLWPRWMIQCGGVDIPVSRLSYDQFTTVTAASPSRVQLASVPQQGLENIAEVHRVLSTAGISLEQALSILPSSMHVNLQIIYPSEDEERMLGLGPTVNVNSFLDAMLTVVFDHAREQRARRMSAPDTVRSVVFSSYNPTLCTTLNWKQPNFPVFLCNDLGRAEVMPAPNVIQSSGRRTFSVKEVVRIAQNNNFMGLICCSRLLEMVPALVDAIKSNGLALVIDKSAERVEEPRLADPFPRMPKGVDGLLKSNGVLRFNESIGV